MSKTNVNRFNENLKEAQKDGAVLSKKSVFTLKSGTLDKHGDAASKRASEVGSKRPSVFSKQS